MTLENVEDDYDFRCLRYDVEDLVKQIVTLRAEVEKLKNGSR